MSVPVKIFDRVKIFELPSKTSKYFGKKVLKKYLLEFSERDIKSVNELSYGVSNDYRRALHYLNHLYQNHECVLISKENNQERGFNVYYLVLD